MAPEDWRNDTRASYDTVATSYADLVRDALTNDAYLRATLDLFAALLPPGARVADVGCGPGHVTAYLHAAGVDAFGIDLSPAMVDLARTTHPALAFEVGDMTGLDLPAASLDGVIAFWSLIHIPDDLVPQVLAHFHRVLRPGGRLLLGFHVGDAHRLKTEGYGGHPMRVHVHLRPPAKVTAWLEEAGFTVEAQHLLDLAAKTPGAAVFARR
ncbi:class I SAM-dependent DNA methyltransferase [Dactylosporangium sp. McL0621]|uniref:class I SAM-dependent DNA methyltransferase n=1 Tax=Dactylosporangium sp. McL0621 TaxID=3415678 RepID=UPI003CE68B60